MIRLPSQEKGEEGIRFDSMWPMRIALEASCTMSGLVGIADLTTLQLSWPPGRNLFCIFAKIILEGHNIPRKRL